MSGRRHVNRAFTYDSMRARIQKASTEAELECLSDLLDELCNADMITACKYRDLSNMLDDRLGKLVAEGLI